MNKSIEGMCPCCGEYTEVSFEENGCCDRGAYCEGCLYTYEDFEDESEVEIEHRNGENKVNNT